MSTTEAVTRQRPAVDRDGRRSKVAPLLAAGMTIRSISAQTGIPLGAVHRIKRQIEKMLAQEGGGNIAAISLEPPPSYVVRRNVNGVPQDVRRLSLSVFERAVEGAIGRRLLERGNRDDPWAVVSALFAAMFDDHTIEWLNRRGYLRWEQARPRRSGHRGGQRTDQMGALKSISRFESTASSGGADFRYRASKLK